MGMSIHEPMHQKLYFTINCIMHYQVLFYENNALKTRRMSLQVFRCRDLCIEIGLY
jgi:hypothetical protein